MHECPECGQLCLCDDDDVMQEGFVPGCEHWCDERDDDDSDEMRYDEEE